MTELGKEVEGGAEDGAPVPKTRKPRQPKRVAAVGEGSITVRCPDRYGAAVWLPDGRVLRAGQAATIPVAEARSLIDSGAVHADTDLLDH